MIPFHLNVTETKLERFIDANPFVPDAKGERDRRCDEILTIQAMGLKNVWNTQRVSAPCLEFPVDLILHLHFWLRQEPLIYADLTENRF